MGTLDICGCSVLYSRFTNQQLEARLEVSLKRGI